MHPTKSHNLDTSTLIAIKAWVVSIFSKFMPSIGARGGSTGPGHAQDGAFGGIGKLGHGVAGTGCGGRAGCDTPLLGELVVCELCDLGVGEAEAW
jgi:hypothetical protein